MQTHQPEKWLHNRISFLSNQPKQIPGAHRGYNDRTHHKQQSLCWKPHIVKIEINPKSLTLISPTPQISCHMARWDYSTYVKSITYLRAKTNMNQGKSDIIAKTTRRFSNHVSRLLLRSHTFAIIVILMLDLKIHRSMWIHWPFFPKTWTKGHWPLDDLWPHVCWGHMCDSTQGSLCPSPMTIHQCMWIQWSILQNTTYTYYIHTTYTYYIQNEWSHSLFLNSVQARQKNTNMIIICKLCSWILMMSQFRGKEAG